MATAVQAKRVTGRVAAGRTIQVGNPFRIERRTRLVNGEEREFFEQVSVEGKLVYGEGEEITLDEAEAARQRAIGFFKLPSDADSRPLGAIPAVENGHNLVRTVEA
jgi:hypothetical protein